MIENILNELILALNANTEALNKVLASSGAPVVTTATPAAEAPEKPKRGKAKAAEPEQQEEPTNVVELTPREGTPEQVEAEDRESEKQEAIDAAPEPEASVVSGYTPADIRDYVRDYQAHITKQGGNTAAALEAVKTLRSEFGVASLNDLTVEQCGPFFAKVKAALPM